jgi:hypothetical protein
MKTKKFKPRWVRGFYMKKKFYTLAMYHDAEVTEGKFYELDNRNNFKCDNGTDQHISPTSEKEGNLEILEGLLIGDKFFEKYSVLSKKNDNREYFLLGFESGLDDELFTYCVDGFGEKISNVYSLNYFKETYDAMNGVEEEPEEGTLGVKDLKYQLEGLIQEIERTIKTLS